MKYRIKNNLICEEIDDEIIIFDKDKEEFYEFEEVGSFIWKLIDGSDFTEIVQNVCDEYHMNFEVVKCDIQEFLDDLVSKELIYLLEKGG